MKKILTSLLANFAVITSATPLMANQVTSQEIENMRTKLDFWIGKTRNWRNYLLEQFSYIPGLPYPDQNYFFKQNKIKSNFEKSDLAYQIIPYLGNYQTCPSGAHREVKWFDCLVTYYPAKVINLKIHVKSWNVRYKLEKTVTVDDCVIVKDPKTADHLLSNEDINKILVDPKLNGGELSIGVLFFYPSDEATNKDAFKNNWQRSHITSDFYDPSVYINIEVSGEIIYKIRDWKIQELHDKLLDIKRQLNNPDSTKIEEAYWRNLAFMNLA